MGRKKYGNSMGWGNWGTQSWGDYSSAFGAYESIWQSSEERREFKNKISEKALDTLTPIEARVNYQPTSFIKRRKMIVNINSKELSSFNNDGRIDKILELYDKIPYNSDVVDDVIIKKHLIGSDDFRRYIGENNTEKDCRIAIEDYFNGKITYADMRKCFRIPTPEECELFTDSGGGYNGAGRVGSKRMCDKEKRDEIMKLIKSKIVMRDIVENEANLRKGKKINRGFINQTSYKPLVSKNVNSIKKKKLMVIIDSSGSMGHSKGTPNYDAVSFASACAKSGVFDIEHIICHSCSGWENVAPAFKKDELFNYYGGSEGFEVIADNLDMSFLDGVDYIVVLTDLCIGASAEQGIYEYIKNRKHMILSFNRGGTLKGLNVRKISNPRDMVNALGTLVS